MSMMQVKQIPNSEILFLRPGRSCFAFRYQHVAARDLKKDCHSNYGPKIYRVFINNIVNVCLNRIPTNVPQQLHIVQIIVAIVRTGKRTQQNSLYHCMYYVRQTVATAQWHIYREFPSRVANLYDVITWVIFNKKCYISVGPIGCYIAKSILM